MGGFFVLVFFFKDMNMKIALLSVSGIPAFLQHESFSELKPSKIHKNIMRNISLSYLPFQLRDYTQEPFTFSSFPRLLSPA